MKSGFFAKPGTRLEEVNNAPAPPKPSEKYTLAHFETNRLVGEGNFSDVLHVTEKSTNREFALKRIEKAKVERLHKTDDVLMEKHVLNKLNEPGHPNVVKLFGTFKEGPCLYFVLEYFPDGELWEHIHRTGCINLPKARQIIKQLVEAVKYCHDKNIVHRDIKCENVMVCKKTDRVVLIDFGTALDLDRPDLLGSGNGAGRFQRNTFYHYVGTPNFMPPETIHNKPSGKAQDLFAVGALIYQILAGRPPFKAPTEYLTLNKVLANDLIFPPGFSLHAEDLCKKLMDPDPAKRLPLDEILNHAFFHEINHDSIFEKCETDNVLLNSSETLGEFAAWVKGLMSGSDLDEKLTRSNETAAFSERGQEGGLFFRRIRQVMLQELADAVDLNEHNQEIWDYILPGRENHEQRKIELEDFLKTKGEEKGEKPAWISEAEKVTLADWVPNMATWARSRINWLNEGFEDGLVAPPDPPVYPSDGEGTSSSSE